MKNIKKHEIYQGIRDIPEISKYTKENGIHQRTQIYAKER
jgi:hypothetical protein